MKNTGHSCISDSDRVLSKGFLILGLNSINVRRCFLFILMLDGYIHKNCDYVNMFLHSSHVKPKSVYIPRKFACRTIMFGQQLRLQNLHVKMV